MVILKQHTAATVLIGPLVGWRDGKTLLTETPALSDLACVLYKNGQGQTLDLSGVFQVDSNGMGALDLSAQQTDTAGRLEILLKNAIVENYPSDTILPRTAAFFVLPAAGWQALVSVISGKMELR